MNERFRKLLGQGQDDWNNETVETAPAGVYVFQLQDAQMFEAQDKDGNDVVKIKWEHLIREGEYEGTVIVDFGQPQSKHPFPRKLLRDRIRALGFEPPEDIRDLEELVAAIVQAAPVYQGQLKWKNDFPNVQVKRLIEGQATAPARPAPARAAPQAAAPVPEPAAEGLAIGTAVQFDGEDGPVDGTVTGFGEDDTVRVEATNGDIYDVPAEILTAAPAKAPAPEEDGTRAALLEFAQAQDLEVHDGQTAEELVALLNGYDWQETDLTPDEVTLLKANGIGVAAKPKPKPKPAPRPVKKAAAKKAAKPATKGAKKARKR